MNLYKKLFDLVDYKGELLEGDLHILDSTDSFYEGEKEYRVYHKDGYCFDVKKEIGEEDEETGDVIFWEYSLYSEWDGFKELTVEKAINLVL